MKKLADRITKGEFKHEGIFDGYSSQKINGLQTREIGAGDEWWAYVRGNDLDQTIANAELIAEAFNVTNATGKSPKELQEERDELLKSCKWAKSVFKRLAEEGKCPEWLMSENGGEGIMPLIKATNRIKQ